MDQIYYVWFIDVMIDIRVPICGITVYSIVFINKILKYRVHNVIQIPPPVNVKNTNVEFYFNFVYFNLFIFNLHLLYIL